MEKMWISGCLVHRRRISGCWLWRLSLLLPVGDSENGGGNGAKQEAAGLGRSGGGEGDWRWRRWGFRMRKKINSAGRGLFSFFYLRNFGFDTKLMWDEKNFRICDGIREEREFKKMI